MADEPIVNLKKKPAADDKPVVPPDVEPAPSGRLLVTKQVGNEATSEELMQMRREAAAEAQTKAEKAGLTSFALEYTETGPNSFQVEVKPVG